MTLPSPTGSAGPDCDGGSGGGGGVGENEGDAGAGTEGEGGSGEVEEEGAYEGAAAAGCAPGDIGGAGGIAHEAVVTITSPHPAAATATAVRPIGSAPTRSNSRIRGEVCRAVRRHGPAGPCGPAGAAGPAAGGQPKLGISPTVVDMSITAKAAPCGSVTAANRPNGLSIGPKCSFPPCFCVFDTASSQSGTAK